MTSEKTIGLVVAPGVTENLAQSIMEEITNILAEEENHQFNWKVELVVDPLTGSAETVEEIFKKINDYHDDRKWNYVVGITDLPIFHKQRVLALDMNMRNGAAVFSYPAFGWRPLRKRFRDTIVTLVNEVHNAEQENREYDLNDEIRETLNQNFPLSKIKKDEVYLEETETKHMRYLSSSLSRGMFRLVSGMTFANNPLNMMVSLSNIVAIAFTTGAFGLIFTTMWQMSDNFSMLRLFGISLIAIVGMMLWIMFSHELWEPIKGSQKPRIIWLYNLTTVATLLVATIIYYIILYLLFLIAELVLLPADFLGKQVGLNSAAGIDLYLSIPWFAASIYTVAGAIGAGLLNDELIKESTYGYRQRERYDNNK